MLGQNNSFSKFVGFSAGKFMLTAGYFPAWFCTINNPLHALHAYNVKVPKP